MDTGKSGGGVEWGGGGGVVWAPMRETRTAVVELRDGLLVARIRPGVHQTLDDARANLAACAAEAGRRCGVMLNISRAVPLDPAVRRFYSGPAISDVCSALALVVEVSPLGRMMGNVYLRVARLDLPTRVFHDEAQALVWLRRAPGRRLRA